MASELELKLEALRDANPAAAPGPAYGFSLQQTRFLVWLLKSSNEDVVCLEVFEDIGVLMADGTIVPEQVTSSFASNPVSNRATKLWKTLSSWTDALVHRRLLPIPTRFVLYVGQSASGPLVRKMQQANTIDSAQRLIEEIASSFAAEPAGAELAPFVATVLSNRREFAEVLSRFELDAAAGRPLDEATLLLRNELLDHRLVEHALHDCLGWLKDKTDEMHEGGMPIALKRSDFRSHLLGYARRNDRNAVLVSFAKEPSDSEVQQHLRERTFVRQLDLVECGTDDKLRAVGDYLRASADRTEWSDRGEVHDDSFADYADGLKRQWRLRKQEVELTFQGPETSTGRLLYVRCSGIRIPLQSMETPDHFGPGSLHALADRKEIGWHPRYPELLNGEASK